MNFSTTNLKTFSPKKISKEPVYNVLKETHKMLINDSSSSWLKQPLTNSKPRPSRFSILLLILCKDKEIFVRELISNASTHSKSRTQLTEKNILDENLDLEINNTDDSAKQLIIQILNQYDRGRTHKTSVR